MSCDALIVSIQDLERYCNLSQAVKSNEVDVITAEMQITYIEPILKEDLYNELLEQIESDTLTTANQDLVDKIKPALSWLVYSDLVTDTNIKNTASGMTKAVADSFTLANNEELSRISKKAFGRWQVRERQLITFLKNNKDNYPLWDDKTCIDKGIAGYSISSIGGNHTKERYLNVHYPTRNK